MRPQPGELVQGKYRVQRLLADGGMGSIYEARHEMLGTRVALKFLHPDLARRQGLVARFLQEAHVSATLRSPNIVQVLDVEQISNGAFLVMELLEGETLQQMLDRQRRVDRAVAIDLSLQMLSALEVAHAAGVVHRDLKPDNVFLVGTPQGTLVKLLDFGIAKLRSTQEFQRGLTRPGVVMGTPEYMAPEQAYSADTVDARADIYAMGVMLFEMLAGQRPVGGDEPKAIAQKVWKGQVIALSAVDPAAPTGLVAAVHRAMAPMPNGRFSSAREMQQALMPFAGALSGHTQRALEGAQGSWAPQSVGVPSGPAGTARIQPLTGSSQLPQAPPTPPMGSLQGTPVMGSQAASMASAPPMSVAPQTPPMASLGMGAAMHQPAQVQLPAEPPRRSGVAKTLPPEDPPPGTQAGAPLGPGTTAPRDPVPHAFVPTAQTPVHGASGSYAQNATVLPGQQHGMTALGPGPSTQLGASPGQTAPIAAPYPTPAALYPTPASPRPKKGPPMFVVAALAALSGGLVVLGVLLYRDQGRDDRPPSPPPTYSMTPPTPPPSASVALPFPTPPVGHAPPTPQPQPQPQPRPIAQPARDGGAPLPDAGADGGVSVSLPIPFDAGSLPIPSALPPIQIPIPGLPIQ